MTYRMHIKHINVEIVSRDAQTFKHLQTIARDIWSHQWAGWL